jgi:hypothetical protein
MPSTSAKQAKFMRAVANSPKFAKKVGVSQSVGKEFEMADKKKKMRKFSEGGRAERMRDRRAADIEKDYQKALAKGKSSKEAEAKRNQRLADMADDYAKRTGADRTQTRAAEKAAEARLTAARRSPDKDVKAVSVAKEAPLRTALVDTTELVKTPDFSPKKPSPARSAPRRSTTARSAGKSPAYDAAALRRLEAEVTRPKRERPAPTPTPTPTPAKEKSAGVKMIEASSRRQQAQINELGGTLRNLLSGPERIFRHIRARGEADDKARGVANAKGGKVKKYAKGGKIDGIALRGKTKAKRKK